MKVIIQNGRTELVLDFITVSEIDKMKTAIRNCIENPEEYPMINYEDKKDIIFLTSNYLQNSLIRFPKEDYIKQKEIKERKIIDRI